MNNQFEARTVSPNTRMRRANTVGKRGNCQIGMLEKANCSMANCTGRQGNTKVDGSLDRRTRECVRSKTGVVGSWWSGTNLLLVCCVPW